MKVLYTHCLPTEDHPATRMVGAIAEELRQRGHTVKVHRSHPLAAGGPAKTSAAPWHKRIGWFARAVYRNRKAISADTQALSSFAADVVIARQDAYCFSTPLVCQRLNVPMVTYADAPVAYESRHFALTGRWHPPRLVEAIERFGLARSRAVIAVSRSAARILRGYQAQQSIEVITNGVDTSRFHPLNEEVKACIRKELNVTTPHIAGFVGSFQSFHGLPLLQNVIRATAGRTDLTWLLVGDGPGRHAMQQSLADHPRVLFTGRQLAERVPALLGAMDVLVAPHQRVVPEFYFCPLKVLEGMAAGVPCLASTQGDIPILLNRGRAGEIVDSECPLAWAQRLVSLLDAPERRHNLAKAARRHVETHFTWAHTARQVERVLLDVVNAPRPRELKEVGP